MTPIGTLNRRITIEEPITAPDGAGGEDVTWQVFATRWATVRPRHGSEQLIGDATTSSITHTITLRYTQGLMTDMRIAYADRRFDILTIIDVDEAGHWHECRCRERPS